MPTLFPNSGYWDHSIAALPPAGDYHEEMTASRLRIYSSRYTTWAPELVERYVKVLTAQTEDRNDPDLRVVSEALHAALQNLTAACDRFGTRTDDVESPDSVRAHQELDTALAEVGRVLNDPENLQRLERNVQANRERYLAENYEHRVHALLAASLAARDLLQPLDLYHKFRQFATPGEVDRFLAALMAKLADFRDAIHQEAENAAGIVTFAVQLRGFADTADQAFRQFRAPPKIPTPPLMPSEGRILDYPFDHLVLCDIGRFSAARGELHEQAWQDCCERRLAVAMGTHPRLGTGALFSRLDPDLLRRVGILLTPDQG